MTQAHPWRRPYERGLGSRYVGGGLRLADLTPLPGAVDPRVAYVDAEYFTAERVLDVVGRDQWTLSTEHDHDVLALSLLHPDAAERERAARRFVAGLDLEPDYPVAVVRSPGPRHLGPRTPRPERRA